MGWERKGFLGSNTWKLSRSKSLPGKDEFQIEEIKRVKASRQVGVALSKI